MANLSNQVPPREPVAHDRRGRSFVLGVCALGALTGLALFAKLDGAHANTGALTPRLAPARLATAHDPTEASDAGPAPALRELGRAIVFDSSLSEPPGTSCASCHEPARGFAGNHGSTNGLAAGSRPGRFAKRSTPSLLYLRFVRPFHFHWEEDAPLPDAFAGFFWDGRASSLAAVTPQPLLNADEMGNLDASAVAYKVARAPYAKDLLAAIPGSFDSPEATLRALGDAVAAYLTSDEMSPFTSKYDDYIRGRAVLTPLETEGLAVFKDPTRGACDDCHKMDDKSPKPERSLFTDFGFESVGAPRNRRVPATRDPTFVDLGLCERHDDRTHTDDERFCGSFRTPSLRNVSVRPSFMHNGAFTNLRDVVAFYATRASDPKRWYPSGEAFDDVPAKYKRYVNVLAAPYDRTDGKPAFSEHEVDALVAFLGTLTDAAYR